MAIFVLSMHDDSAYVREAFAQGATGYLLKEAADEELLTAVREVAAGHQYVHPMLGARLASNESRPPQPSRDDGGVAVRDNRAILLPLGQPLLRRP